MEDSNVVSESYTIQSGLGANKVEGVIVHGRYDIVHRRVKAHMMNRFLSLQNKLDIVGIEAKNRIEAIMDRMRFTVEEFATDNVVVDDGKKYLLDSINTTTTAVGPYLGLITSGAPSTTTTMANAAGFEAASSVIALRLLPTFSAASGSGTITKAATAVTFTAAGAGATITGCMLVCGAGAVNTPANTAGRLYSCGTFTSKTLAPTDTLQVTYSTTLA